MDKPTRQSTELVSITFPQSFSISFLRSLFLILAGSAFIALLARISVPLPFSPVPITGQTLGVILVGLALGARKGTAAVLTYLVLGLSGMPVFALGSGPAYILGPTGGYLVGFLPAACLAGIITQRKHSIPFTLLALLAAAVAIYLPGLLWLSRFVGASRVLPLGLFPFLPGDAVKTLVALITIQTGWHLTRRSLA